MIKTRSEAEQYVYESYLRAQRWLHYGDPDSLKRHPEYVASIINSIDHSPSINITGSKGKGSVSCMIDTILSTRLLVGRFTSPHVRLFNERICFRGLPISDADFIKYANEVQALLAPTVASLNAGDFISPIAIQVLISLLYFDRMGTDCIILECGKGAQYDDVNSVSHDYSVITPIFLEHTRELGLTVEEIAFDKAHIISEEQLGVFVSPQTENVYKIIRSQAEKYYVPLFSYGIDFYAYDVSTSQMGTSFSVRTMNREYDEISIPLLGRHQAQNCALSIAVSEMLCPSLSSDDIRVGLSKLRCPGRLEVVSKNPFILLDACINSVSSAYVIDTLQSIGIETASFIIGIPSDKDFIGVAKSIMKYAMHIILTKSSNPHYHFDSYQTIQVQQLDSKMRIEWANSLQEALGIALEDCLPIVVLGTTALIADYYNLVGNDGQISV